MLQPNGVLHFALEIRHLYISLLIVAGAAIFSMIHQIGDRRVPHKNASNAEIFPYGQIIGK